MARLPKATAPFTASARPRALNDWVGFGDSSFSHSSPSPSSCASRGSGSSGVPPSPRRTAGKSAAKGSTAR